jgi:hypothetical protein
MRTLFLAGIAVVGLSTAANAAVQTTFMPGGASPSTGFTVIDTFDNLSGVSSTTGTVLIKSPPSDGQGAPPANSIPAGTSYLSVLGGGSATITFAKAVTAFQFDWGSIDSYNTLTVFSSIGSKVFVPGTASFPNTANGNQFLPGTNGLFTVNGTSGTAFTGFKLESSSNSFEIDNLAVKGVVPEPATWAMLIAGFGLVGASLRRQRMTPARVSA